MIGATISHWPLARLEDDRVGGRGEEGALPAVRVIFPSALGSELARFVPLEVGDLGGADAGAAGGDGEDVGEGVRFGIGEGEAGKRGHLESLAFETAVDALRHFRLLLAEEQKRKNADDNDLEEDQSGHELAANRPWSEQRHRPGGNRVPSGACLR